MTITDRAWQMILQVSRWMPVALWSLLMGRMRCWSSAESDRLPLVSVIARLRLDACCTILPQCVKQETSRRTQRHSEPKLAERLLDPRRSGRQRCPGRGTRRAMEIATGTALWYHLRSPCASVGCSSRSRSQVRANGLAVHRSEQRLPVVRVVSLRWTAKSPFRSADHFG